MPDAVLVAVEAPVDGAGEVSVDGVGEVKEGARRIVERGLAYMRAWTEDERFASSRLVFVTRGAVGTGSREELPGLVSSALWGLVRSAQAESPGCFARIDVDQRALSRAVLEEGLRSAEPQLALREGRVLVPRLSALETLSGAAGARLGGGGTVLVTGGTGALGRLLARHLIVEHGVEHLLLTSRRGLAATGAQELREELADLGAEVTIAACDVGDREQLRAVLDSIASEHPLSAVVHAAGVAQNGLLGALTPEMIDGVLRPKLDGALHLQELTAGSDLDAFVCFSSMAGVLGGPGQGNYAAANAFLDAFAEHSRARGRRAVSIAWGLWSGVDGDARFDADDMRRLAGSAGVEPIPAEQALHLFDLAVAGDRALVIPAQLDYSVLKAR